MNAFPWGSLVLLGLMLGVLWISRHAAKKSGGWSKLLKGEYSSGAGERTPPFSSRRCAMGGECRIALIKARELARSIMGIFELLPHEAAYAIAGKTK